MLDADLRVVISRRLRDETAEAEGRRLVVPGRFPPAGDALQYHRETIFMD